MYVPLMPDETNFQSSTSFNRITSSYLCYLRLSHIGHGGLNNIVKNGYGIGNNITSCISKGSVMGLLLASKRERALF